MSSLLFLFTVVLGFGIFYAIASRRFFDAPCLYALHGLFLMGIPPLLYLCGFHLDYALINDFDRDSANLLLSLAFAVSMSGTLCGYLIFRRLPLGGFLFPGYNYDRSRLMTFIGVCTLSIIGFLVILLPLNAVHFNIVQAVFEIRYGGFFFGGLNFIRQFLFFGSMISGAFLIALLQERKAGQSISDAMLWSVAGMFTLNILMSFVLGGKSFVVFPLAATLLGYEICVRKKGLSRIILILSLITSLIVGLQVFRASTVGGNTRSVSEYIYTGLYFIVYDTTLLFVETHNKRHFTETGEDFKNGFILLIPRILWPDKPATELTAGNRFARQISPEKENPGGKPPYGFAQWYTNFGWLGVFVGGMLTGWVLAALQRKYGDFADNPFSFVIMWHVIFIVLGPWPGGIHNISLLNYVLYIFPLFIFKWLTKTAVYRIND